MRNLFNKNTLAIFNNFDIVSLQYHPSSLSSTERSQVQSIQGLSKLITFIPTQNNTIKTVNITAFFSQLTHDEINEINTGINAVGAGAGSALAVLSAGQGQIARTVYTRGLQAIGLLGGAAYDISTGLIRKSKKQAFLVTDNNIDKFKKLCEFMRMNEEVNISWDIDNETTKDGKYLIQSINYTVENINDRSGDTMELRADIILIQQGVRVGI